MAGTAHLICGMICSGKSHYAKALRERTGAVILSCDEITLLFPPLGEKHDEVTAGLRALLLEKAADVARGGCDVILEWGFWQRAYRRETEAYFLSRGIPVRRHYIAASEETLRRHIAKRNQEENGPGAYYVDEGLLNKCLSLFEPPLPEETDEWIVPEA